jgi:hypothetical protein
VAPAGNDQGRPVCGDADILKVRQSLDLLIDIAQRGSVESLQPFCDLVADGVAVHVLHRRRDPGSNVLGRAEEDPTLAGCMEVPRFPNQAIDCGVEIGA